MQPDHLGHLKAHIISGWYEGVRAAIVAQPRLVHLHDHLSNLPIHIAAKHGANRIVRLLISTWPESVLAGNRRGDTPMHMAALHAKASTIRTLFEANPAAAHAPNMYGSTPLHLATVCQKHGADEAFHVLHQLAPDVALMANNAGDTPLHLAIRACNLPAVQELSKCQTALAMRNKDHHLPVHVAITTYSEMMDRSCHARTGSVLIHMLNLHRQTSEEPLTQLRLCCDEVHPILHVAAQLGHTDVARLILDLDSSAAQEPDRYAKYAIHCAAESGATAVIQMLLEAAPHLAAAPTKFMATPLHLAAQSNSGEAVRMLMAAAPLTVSALTSDGYTPTHFAAIYSNLDGLRLLLAARPGTAEIPDFESITPLRSCAWHNNTEAVEMLLQCAPETAEVAGFDGCNALHIAAEYDCHGVVRTILKFRPDLASKPASDGSTPLHIAMRPDYDGELGTQFKEDTKVVHTVRALLEADPTCALVPSLIPHDTSLPIHLAASLGMDLCTDALLRAAPSAVHVTDSHANTPLDCALLGGHWSSALLLIRTPEQDPADALLSLGPHYADEEAKQLCVATVAAHMPLSARCWSLVPAPLTGLLDALPAAVEFGMELDMRQLTSRLAPEDRRFVTTAVAVLHKHLPPAMMQLILSKCVACGPM